MLSSSEVKYIKSLSQKKFRDLFGVFTVEGEKLVEEAVRSGFRVEKVYRREEIGEAAMARISSLSSPSPVLAVIRSDSADRLPSVPGKGLYLALDGIRDPGNMGTILRIADWFGLDGVYMSPDSVEVFNPKVVQATMGAIFRVPFRSLSIPDLCKAVSDKGGSVWGTFLDGRNIYESEIDGKGDESPSVIVIGNESNGISPETAAHVTGRLFIPPFPEGERRSESLNAAVATAVAVAEFRRRAAQR